MNNQLNNKNETNRPVAIAGYNLDEAVRLNSSSGGLFTLIAEYVICNNGIVFGASFDKDFKLYHEYTQTKEGLERFRCSKYIQSNIGMALRKAKQFLDEGRLVLFSGTPCQIAGLKSFLKKPYENLICIDFICYGVPPQYIFDKYKSYMEKKYKSKFVSFNFRNKDYGWTHSSIYIEFENQKIYQKPHEKDLYMRGFRNKLISIEPCYNCKFKGFDRQSDFTLADFFGIRFVNPEMFDNKGTSLMLINSNKAAELFEKIKGKIRFIFVDIEKVRIYNHSAEKSMQKNKYRKDFLFNLDKKPFNVLINKYCKPPLKNRLKGIISFVLRKVLNIRKSRQSN